MPEGLEPCGEFHERLRSQSVQASLRFNSRLHKPRLSQHSQVLGHRWLRQLEFAFYIANRAL
jgi:hypothetical protein